MNNISSPSLYVYERHVSTYATVQFLKHCLRFNKSQDVQINNYNYSENCTGKKIILK